MCPSTLCFFLLFSIWSVLLVSLFSYHWRNFRFSFGVPFILCLFCYVCVSFFHLGIQKEHFSPNGSLFVHSYRANTRSSHATRNRFSSLERQTFAVVRVFVPISFTLLLMFIQWLTSNTWICTAPLTKCSPSNFWLCLSLIFTIKKIDSFIFSLSLSVYFSFVLCAFLWAQSVFHNEMSKVRHKVFSSRPMEFPKCPVFSAVSQMWAGECMLVSGWHCFSHQHPLRM